MPTKKKKTVPATPICPNCTQPLTDLDDACVLEALGGVLMGRGHAMETVIAFLATVDVDALWETLGPVIDGLEDEMDDEDEEESDADKE